MMDLISFIELSKYILEFDDSNMFETSCDRSNKTQSCGGLHLFRVRVQWDSGGKLDSSPTDGNMLRYSILPYKSGWTKP